MQFLLLEINDEYSQVLSTFFSALNVYLVSTSLQFIFLPSSWALMHPLPTALTFGITFGIVSGTAIDLRRFNMHSDARKAGCLFEPSLHIVVL